MPGRIVVGESTLVVGGGDVQVAINGLEQVLGELQQLIDGLDHTWLSQGNAAFVGYYRLWNTYAGDLHATLERLRNLLYTAHGNYHAAETANLAMWGRR